MLSSIGARYSQQLAETDLFSEQPIQEFTKKLSDYLLSNDLLRKATYQELATLIWIFALQPGTFDNGKVFWDQL
jgi:hypothetical protein